jgi:glycosyltransferase involved in cell wall biosynthesis
MTWTKSVGNLLNRFSVTLLLRKLEYQEPLAVHFREPNKMAKGQGLGPERMRVSVVICEHTMDRYDDLQEAADSVRSQTYEDVELVLVSDGNERVCERFREDYGSMEDVVVHCNEDNVGLLESRNNGANVATGDVVAFLDDDAVADPDWVAELVDVYRNRDVLAVGGKMTPIWVAGKPKFLPEEFYWIVGVTHRGFAEGPGYVRNTFGSNISFQRDVFLELGGFDTQIGGRKGDKNLQGGETELCTRLAEQYDERVWYNPYAKVGHKVFGYRTNLRWLLDRAFWQGYSKRAMEIMLPDTGRDEGVFLIQLMSQSLPNRTKSIILNPSISRVKQLVALVLFTFVVGIGYLYGILKW